MGKATDNTEKMMAKWEKRARRRLFVHTERAKMGWKDWVLMLAITAAYAAAAFTNLGSHDIPETFFSMQSEDEVVIEFTQPEQIRTIKYFTSFGNGMVSFYHSDDGEGYEQLAHPTQSEEVDENGNPMIVDNPFFIDHDAIDMYEWQFIPTEFDAKYVSLRVDEPGMQMLEMGFCGEDGLPVSIASVTNLNPDAARGNPAINMFDEQQHVRQQTYYMDEMYFDEVYHARTAYEHINHMYPYEITHPPLGKSIISLGIRIFGMNPFGWRFMGALFGVLMLPLMYYFGKRLFKKTAIAFIPAFLLATDFMHYSQTRIATIDSFSIFFILLMFLFMYIYSEKNYNRQPFRKSLLPLALCGIAFGLGGATKWLCLYGGIGLAVLLFISLGRRYSEYQYARHALKLDEQAGTMDAKKRLYLREISQNYVLKTAMTLLWCVLFFIAVPLIIYYLAYIPYMNVQGSPFGIEQIMQNQEYMYSYHSVSVLGSDPHPFASEWYMWPINYRPVFLFQGDNYPAGMMSTMSTMGNPAVWWGALLSVIALLFIRLKKGPFGNKAVFLSVAALSQFLPWVIIQRETYIYHYFATIVFLMLLMGLLFKYVIENYKHGSKAVYAYLGVCLALFVMFYPVITGTPVSREYSDTFLRWLPSWPFY